MSDRVVLSLLPNQVPEPPSKGDSWISALRWMIMVADPWSSEFKWACRLIQTANDRGGLVGGQITTAQESFERVYYAWLDQTLDCQQFPEPNAAQEIDDNVIAVDFSGERAG